MSQSAPNPVLDEIDRRILEALQIDGGCRTWSWPSASALAFGLLAPRASTRGSASGHGRVTLVDRSKGGLSLTAIIQVAMTATIAERFATFEKRCARAPRCRPATWSQARTPTTCSRSCCPTWSLPEFLLNKITRIEGVIGVRSSFVMRRVIETTVLPLGHL